MKRDVQFVRAVDARFDRVCDVFRSDPTRVLGDTVNDDGEIVANLIAHLGGTEVNRDIRIEIVAFDEPVGVAPGAHLLLRGDASHHPDLFPHLEARIDVIPMSNDRTALFFVGTYKPPFGILGGAADGVALHRYAEESLMRWFDGVVRRAESAARA